MASGANSEVRPVHEGADPMHANCPGRALFELVTGKWTLLILWSLDGTPLRFFQVRDRVQGISERVLSDVLRRLSDASIVSRHVEPSIPPKVSYALAPSGRELLAATSGLIDWIAGEIDRTASDRNHDGRQG